MENRRNELLRGEREPASKRLERIGSVLALSAAIHGGALFHREIGTMIQEVPRNMRAFANSYEAGKAAEKMLDSFREQLEAGEPLDLDLSEFHFQDELLRGGVSQAEVERAKEKYRSILEEANKLQDSGAPKDEVLGYVLKMQGEHRTGRALMTDLLNEGYGNCEARAKYISATVQDLYPEYAEEGKLQIQNFGEWRDANGDLHPGHLRVVLDEGGDAVSVLEGDAVFKEVKDPENPIPQFEATNALAKAVLADADVFSYRKGGDGAVLDTGIQKTVAEKAKQWTSGRNSTLSFPRSTAIYGDTRGTANIRPIKVADSWARSNFEWKPDMELVSLDIALTKEKVVTLEPNSLTGDFDLRAFTSVNAEAWTAMGERLDHALKEEKWRPSITLSPGMEVNMNDWTDDVRDMLQVNFSDFPKGNELKNEKVWLNMDIDQWTNLTNFGGANIEDSFIYINYNPFSLDPVGESLPVTLPEYAGAPAAALIFRSSFSADVLTLPPHLGSYTKTLEVHDMNFIVSGAENMKIDKIVLQNNLNFLPADVWSDISEGRNQLYGWGMSLRNVDAKRYDLAFHRGETIDKKFFHDEIHGTPSPVYENKIISVTDVGIGKDAFVDMHLAGLVLSKISFAAEGSLKGAKITKLEIADVDSLWALNKMHDPASTVIEELYIPKLVKDELERIGKSSIMYMFGKKRFVIEDDGSYTPLR